MLIPRKNRSYLASTIVSFGLFLVAPFCSKAADYYVAVSGLDSNPGTQALPWKTCNKVNNSVFAPGDTIYFHRGDSWTSTVSGSFLLSPGGGTAGGTRTSGTASAPITIDAYGTGTDLPLFQGSGITTAVILLVNQQHWRIKHLEVSNTKSGTFPHGDKRLNGIDVYFDDHSGAGTFSGVRINDCYVHMVDGICWSGNSLGNFKHNGGINVHVEPWLDYDSQASSSSPHPLVYLDDISIHDNVVEDVNGAGIMINNWLNGSFPKNSRATCSTNCTINNNIVRRSNGDGIVIRGGTGPRLTHNVVYDAGFYYNSTVPNNNNPTAIVGLWTAVAKDAICANNEVARTRMLTSTGDGDAFDSDGSSTGTHIYEYNYTHDNDGAFLLRPQFDYLDVDGVTVHVDDLPRPNLVIRYNLSINDGQGGLNGSGYSQPYFIYYSSTGGTGYTGTQLGAGGDGTISIYNNVFSVASGTLSPRGNSNHYSFKNNVFSFSTTPAWVTSATYANNAYVGVTAPAGDAAPVFAANNSAVFVSPSSADIDGIDNAVGYKLKAASVGIGAGTAIANNGGLDFFGQVIPTSPTDIGISAYSGTSARIHNWPLDNTGTDTVNGNTLTLTAGTGYSALSPRRGTANMVLNGSSNYAYNSAIGGPGTGSYTIAFWIRRHSWANGSGGSGPAPYSPFMAAKGNIYSTVSGWSMSLGSSSDKASFRVSDGTNAASTNGTIPISDNQWHHLSMVIDQIGGRVVGALDGVTSSWTAATSSVTTDSLIGVGSISSTDSFSLGNVLSGGASGGKFFDGDIDDAQIFAAALDKRGITQLAYPEMVGWWPFNNYAGDVSTGNSGSFGLINGAAFTNAAVNPPKPGNTFSLNFTGASSQYATNASAPNPGTGSFSVSLWYKRSSSAVPAVSMMLASKGNSVSTNAGWSIFVGTNGGVYVRCNAGGGTTARAGETGPIKNDTEWHHLVMTIDRTNNIIHGYLDGSNAGWSAGGGGATTNSLAAFGSNPITATENTAVGSVLASSTPSLFYSGSINDLRVVTRTLSPVDVLNLAQP